MTAVELFDTILETPTLAATRILYTAGSKVTVNAPASHVWAILLDFPKYGDWNRDTPKMHLADGETLVVGSKPLMKIKMSAQGNREYDIPINILELQRNPSADEPYVLAWRGEMLPAWFATSERMQTITPLKDDPNACEVKNWESMAGWGAYIFKYIMGVPTQMKDFNMRYAEDLKARAESTWRPS